MIPQPKMTNVLVCIRKSQRLATLNSIKSGRHLEEAQPAECSEENTTNRSPLNDHCLLEIFSHLTLIDSSTVSACCRQFKALANDVARKKCQGKHFSYKVQQSISKYLKCFRESIQDLFVYRETIPSNVFANTHYRGWRSVHQFKLWSSKIRDWISMWNVHRPTNIWRIWHWIGVKRQTTQRKNFDQKNERDQSSLHSCVAESK